MYLSKYLIVYIEIERKIDFYFQMQQIEKQFEIELTLDGIQTAEKNFQLQHVHDISYKPFSFGGGMLYLHTNQGVFSFKIQEDPRSFIEGFRMLKNKLRSV